MVSDVAGYFNEKWDGAVRICWQVDSNASYLYQLCMPRESKPRLDDPGAEDWYRAMARRSRITADVNYRRLRAFCEQMNLRPVEIVRRARKQIDVRNLLNRFVDQEVAKGRATWYIHSTVVAVKSWLAFHDKPLRLKVELPANTISPRREEERVPTVEELRAVMLQAKPHERVVVALMAFSGVRPGAIGSYAGDDGLRLRDLPELHYAGDACRSPDPQLHLEGRAIFSKVPTRIRVRTTSSKARHQYLTFLGEEGCAAVAQYLEQRLAAGETFTPDTDLAHPRYEEKRFLRSVNIGHRVRRVFKAVGLKDAGGQTPRPYVLRRYFLNRCLEAQSKVGIPDRFVEFWAGHRGDVTAQYYTTGLPNLPESMVEEMRSSYQRAEPFLSTVPVASEALSQGKMAKVMLMGLGYTEAELGKLDLANLDSGAFQDLVSAGPILQKKAPPSPARVKQKMVAAEELPGFLDQGWTVVTALNGDRVIIAPPAT